MSLSIFCVVSNALRLNLCKLYDGRKDKPLKHSRKQAESYPTETNLPEQNKKKEKETMEMEKTLEITGMMCGHCEARVKKTLEALEGVTEAVVSHEKGTAVVKLAAQVEDEVLKNAVEAQDYTVTALH